MQLEQIHEINGVRIGIFKTTYHPSATENAGHGWRGYVWSRIDKTDKSTKQPKQIFGSFDAALTNARETLENDDSN